MAEVQVVPPVFIKQEDIQQRATTTNSRPNTTPYELCEAITRLIGAGTVEGAQRPDSPRGCWRIYLKSLRARAQLLARREIRLNGVAVQLYDANPLLTNQNSPDDLREKITVKYLPLSVSNDEIEKYLIEQGVKLTSKILYCRERDPDGRLTEYKNGDRYCPDCGDTMQVFPQRPVQQRLQGLQ